MSLAAMTPLGVRSRRSPRPERPCWESSDYRGSWLVGRCDFFQVRNAAAARPTMTGTIGAPALNARPAARMHEPRKYFQVFILGLPPQHNRKHCDDRQRKDNRRCCQRLVPFHITDARVFQLADVLHLLPSDRELERILCEFGRATRFYLSFVQGAQPVVQLRVFQLRPE